MMNAIAKTSLSEQRSYFAKTDAAHLAEAAGGPTKECSAFGRLKLSKVASYFEDAERLVVVAGPHVSPTAKTTGAAALDRDTDLGVAYGLAYAEDRCLVAVLPADASHPTLTRAPWLRDVEVWTYDLDPVSQRGDYSSIRKCRQETQDEILETYGGAAYASAQHLGDDHLDRYLKGRARWVDRLIRWAEDDPDLEAAHRQSYLAWHCQGRMVMKIARTKGGLRVTAGVHRGDKTNQPRSHGLKELIEPDKAHRLIAAASLAAADRLDGTDTGHREHQLQAALVDGLQPLGIVDPKREYPAFRPTNDPKRPSRSYIDFLGSDNRGRMHVVETKIGNDPMLVLQGLDYWIWATASATTLQANFDLPQRPEVLVDFVTAAPISGGSALGPYSRNQAKRLVDEVRYSFWELRAGTPEPL